MRGIKTLGGRKKKDSLSLDEPSLYINRELSWLRFNERLLEEAQDKSHPLLERVKFLAIAGNNLDEFFMVRVSGLRKQILDGVLSVPADGMSPSEQLKAIRKEALKLLERYRECWSSDLSPALSEASINIRCIRDLPKKQKTALRRYFTDMIFPALTPMAVDIFHPFPFISNLSVNLMVVLRDERKRERHARVKVPTSLFPRLITIPSDGKRKCTDLVFLEDLIAENLDLLFPGVEVVASYPFRITRDAEMEIALDEAPDLLTAIEDGVEERKLGLPIRLQVDNSMPASLKELFMNNLGLSPEMVYPFDGPLGLVDLWQLHAIDWPDLKDPCFPAYSPPELGEERSVFSALARRDYFLYHPYDSFNAVVNLLRQAACDPDVLAIKITLYRIDANSPVIDALMAARQNGKAVTALVELKAKFDETNNINWARKLEHEGVHVIYGLVDLKVHAKICLIVRKEGEKIVRYSHIGSGNYNASTSRIYADLGYLTADERIGGEVTALFNALTGYSRKDDYKYLLVAPKNLKKGILERIEREIASHRKSGGGYIAFKINGLIDKEIIRALYRASIAGVKVELNVRGLCCLRPGLPGVSENISVKSIVGRFLEHARIYYFRNGGDEEVILGSSDMMPRNLVRRVEVLFPVPDARLGREIVDKILETHLKDNVKARRLLFDGSYERVRPAEGEEAVNSQEWLIANRGVWHAGPKEGKNSN